MKYCLYCGKEVKNKYCNVGCQNRHQNRLKFEKKRVEIIKNCEHCGKEFTQIIIENGNSYIKRYCSLSCANSRIQTKEQNESRSIKLTRVKIVKPKLINIKLVKPKSFKVCQYCGSSFYKSDNRIKFCCRSCSSKYKGNLPEVKEKLILGGLKSASVQSETRRSKNEIYFSELCKNYFIDVLTNVNIFNGWDADIIINDLKIAVLWNGKWHYEKLTKKHSVIQVQNRDKIKISEIVKCKYTPYIIKDMGKFNKSFVEEEFYKLKIYCGI